MTQQIVRAGRPVAIHPERHTGEETFWPYGRLGSVAASSPPAWVAGGYGTLVIKHTVGPYGIDDAGGLKLLWVVQADIGIPQFDDPAAAGYTSVRTTGDARLVPRWAKRASVRPWSKGIHIDVMDGSLAPGDVVEIIVGDRSSGGPGTRAQSYAEHDAALRLLVDPFATGVFYPVAGDTGFHVVAGPADRLIATVRGTADGRPATLSVRAVDRYGNVAVSYRGVVTVRDAGGKDALARLTFGEREAGVVTAPLPVARGDRAVWFEVADERGLTAVSNPLPARGSATVLWGDTQGQTGETVGAGTIEEFFEYARDVARLDFVAHSANDFQITSGAYAESLRACDRYSDEGEFAAFGGFEWSGTTPVGGDHNVLYADTTNAPLARSSHALVDDLGDVDTDAPTVRDLYGVLERSGADAVCVPHVGGRRVELSLIDPRHAPVLEIVSVHGWFEWLALEALELGLIVGVIGASDDHSGRPGGSFPTSPAFGTRNGLAAVQTDDLSRSGILRAMRARHCYATTGERILLDVRSGPYRMGDHWRSPAAPVIEVDVAGTAPVEAVEVLDAHGVIARWEPDLPMSRRRLRVAWRGARDRNRRRTQDWSGGLTLVGACIREARTWAFDHPDQGLTLVGERELAWHSTTNGDSDGVEFETDTDAERILFRAGGVELDIDLVGIKWHREFPLDAGVDRAVTVTRLAEKHGACTAHVVFDRLPLRPGRNPYFVKVHQADGHLAWASPMHVDAEPSSAVS